MEVFALNMPGLYAAVPLVLLEVSGGATVAGVGAGAVVTTDGGDGEATAAVFFSAPGTYFVGAADDDESEGATGCGGVGSVLAGPAATADEGDTTVDDDELAAAGVTATVEAAPAGFIDPGTYLFELSAAVPVAGDIEEDEGDGVAVPLSAPGTYLPADDGVVEVSAAGLEADGSGVRLDAATYLLAPATTGVGSVALGAASCPGDVDGFAGAVAAAPSGSGDVCCFGLGVAGPLLFAGYGVPELVGVVGKRFRAPLERGEVLLLTEGVCDDEAGVSGRSRPSSKAFATSSMVTANLSPFTAASLTAFGFHVAAGAGATASSMMLNGTAGVATQGDFESTTALPEVLLALIVGSGGFGAAVRSAVMSAAKLEMPSSSRSVALSATSAASSFFVFFAFLSAPFLKNASRLIFSTQRHQ